MHCKQYCRTCCCLSCGFSLGYANVTLTRILHWPLTFYKSWETPCRISSKASVNRYVTLESGHRPFNGTFKTIQRSTNWWSRIFNIKNRYRFVSVNLYTSTRQCSVDHYTFVVFNADIREQMTRQHNQWRENPNLCLMAKKWRALIFIFQLSYISVVVLVV